jgi:hypothetical protein
VTSGCSPCTLQDLRTGNIVTNVASIVPCGMVGDGSAVMHMMRKDYAACVTGGSNDDMPGSTAHFICAMSCER